MHALVFTEPHAPWVYVAPLAKQAWLLPGSSLTFLVARPHSATPHTRPEWASCCMQVGFNRFVRHIAIAITLNTAAAS